MNIWDFVKAICETKEDLFQNPEAAKIYQPFIVNRHLSYFPDTVMYANEMNYFRDCPPGRQFKYLLHTIRPRKRFTQWAKVQRNEELTAVMKFFGFGHQKAREVLAILTKEQVSEIVRGEREHATEGAPRHF